MAVVLLSKEHWDPVTKMRINEEQMPSPAFFPNKLEMGNL